LAGVTLDLDFVQALAPLQQLVETLVLAELKQNVDTLAVLEKVLKLRNVLVLDRAVNFDLTHQLLLGAAPLQRALLDDLGRRDRLGVALHELVALGEAALAEELTLHISAVTHLAIRVLDAFLDDLGTRLPILMQVGGAAADLGRGLHQLFRSDAAAGAWAARSGPWYMPSLVIV
jgi:hypothetical protein